MEQQTITFEEAVDILRKSNKTVYIRKYSDDTETYENGDYPIECPDDLIDMNEEDYIVDNYELFHYACDDCVDRCKFIQELEKLYPIEDIKFEIDYIKNNTKNCICGL